MPDALHLRTVPARPPVVVVGDALLDRDVDGRAERLSPDAPVPVVHRPDARSRAGGAALAATLAARVGADVTLVTAIGADDAGDELRTLVSASGVHLVDLGRRGRTTEKVRVRAAGHAVVRLDYDDDDHALLAPAGAADALRVAPAAVLVSDYGRGLVAHPLVRALLEGVARRAPMVWDPHPRGTPPVPGAALVTPNAAEAATDAHDVAAASRVACELAQRWEVGGVAVTLGARGAVLGRVGTLPVVVPVARTATGDPCGAGDAFAAQATVALARGGTAPDAVRAGVEGAGAFLARGGVGELGDPVIPAGDRPTGRVVATSGCFDLLHAGHVAALEAARALGDHLVVLLNSDASVARLKGPGRPLVTQADRERVLRGLACVDDVQVFDDDTPVRALEALRPALFVKGGDYGAATIPEEAVMAQWGGAVVVVPYLEGRSTSKLVEQARVG